MADFWRDRRVCVTGGTGFLGFHVCQQLIASGAKVRSFALPVGTDHPLTRLNVETTCGDIRDFSAVQSAVHDCDVIFHAAGPVAVWGPGLRVMHECHRDGTANVIRAASKSARVIHTSSIVAVGASPHGQVLDESSQFDLSVKIDYVHAKRAAEQIAVDAAANARDVVVVNPGYLVGPDDFEPSVMGKFCARVWRGRMALAAPGGYNLVDVRDVAAGHLLAAERGHSGRRYILGGENHSMQQFMRMLADAAGLRPGATPKLPVAFMWAVATYAELRARRTGREPYPSYQHVRLNQFSWFMRSDRAIAELGYAPRPLTETIRDTFHWYSMRQPQKMSGFTRWWMRPAA